MKERPTQQTYEKCFLSTENSTKDKNTVKYRKLSSPETNKCHNFSQTEDKNIFNKYKEKPERKHSSQYSNHHNNHDKMVVSLSVNANPHTNPQKNQRNYLIIKDLLS